MGRRAYSNRRTVEECKSISTKLLSEHHCFEDGVRWGRLSWNCNSKETDNVGFVVSTAEGNEYIRFQYTHTDKTTDERIELDYKVRLVWTPCYFGGKRWWFICPIIVNRYECGRRVGSLYLGGGKYFGCRHCYDLTYESSRESHKYNWLAKAMATTEKQLRPFFKKSRTR